MWPRLDIGLNATVCGSFTAHFLREDHESHHGLGLLLNVDESMLHTNDTFGIDADECVGCHVQCTKCHLEKRQGIQLGHTVTVEKNSG